MIQSWRRRKLWQCNIDKLDDAINLSTSTLNLGNQSGLFHKSFLPDPWPTFSVFPWKVVPQCSKDDSLHVLKFMSKSFPRWTAARRVVFTNISQIAKFTSKSSMESTWLFSIDFLDHREDWFHKIGCVWRYWEVMVSWRFCTLIFLVNWKNWLLVQNVPPKLYCFGNWVSPQLDPLL